MKISAVRGRVRLASFGATAAVALSVLAGGGAGTALGASRATLTGPGDKCTAAAARNHRCLPYRDADWSSTHVMRYFGGPKQPMYWAPRE